MLHRDAGALLEQLDHQMRLVAAPGDGIVELARVGLRERDELPQRLRRHLGVDQEQQRILRHHDDRREDRARHRRAASRLVAGTTVCDRRHHQQRVAIGRRLGGRVGLITKARSYQRGFPKFIIDFFTQFQEQGPNYVNAILQGYEDKPPAGATIPDGSYYNKYFPGHAIKMPKPLSDGQVTYDDGSPATVAQYANDVTTFLMWTAEPHMEARKRLGRQVFVFLILFAGLMYFTKKKVWANAH